MINFYNSLYNFLTSLSFDRMKPNFFLLKLGNDELYSILFLVYIIPILEIHLDTFFWGLIVGLL